MINAFKYKNNKFKFLDIKKKNTLFKSIWIDLIKPNNIERKRIQQEMNQNLATYQELEDIEASARFFENENGLHIHSSFFYTNEGERAGNTTVAFTIKNEKLYTLREKELTAFNIYKVRILNKKFKNINAYTILLNLFETKIEQLANEIENIYSNLEALSLIIMGNQETNIYNKALSTLAILEDVVWKIRLCLMDTQRALNFLIRKIELSKKQIKETKEILHNTESLLPHNESLFQKVSFLLQAAMGFINIEQNKIIKIFSVVSIVFIPPTLVASSYGMNFKFMPEIKWIFGYPIALILMLLAGLTPYLYFKKKNWL